MNQTQRAFLIKKIEESTKTMIEALKGEKKEYPSVSNYLLNYVMSGNFSLRSADHLKKVIRGMALTSKKDNWLTNQSSFFDGSKKEIHLKVEDVFEMPEEYETLKVECMKHNAEINEKIRQASIQSDSLITRIQLASDKTLQRMINEVDDMGDISLLDTTIRQLSNPEDKKLL